MNQNYLKDPKILLPVIGITAFSLAIPATFFLLWGPRGLLAPPILVGLLILMWEIPMAIGTYAAIVWSWIPSRLRKWAKARVGLAD